MKHHFRRVGILLFSLAVLLGGLAAAAAVAGLQGIRPPARKVTVLYDVAAETASGSDAGGTGNGASETGNTETTTGTGNTDTGSEAGQDTEGSSGENTEEASTETLPDGTSVFTDSAILTLQAQYLATQQERVAIQKMLNDMLEHQNEFIRNMQELDDQILSYQKKLDSLQQQQVTAANTLEKLETDLATANDAVDKQYDLLKSHIRDEYENGNYTYYDVLFSSVDYDELVNRVEYIQAVDAYDQRVLSSLTDARKKIADKQALFDSMQEDIGTLADTYKQAQENLSALSSGKEDQIVEYQKKIDETQSDLETLDQMETAQSDEIARIEAKYASLVSNVSFDGSTFLWPMPSSTVISSGYGPRVAPTAGATSYHRGIDISCAMGSEVTAAAPGVVIYASYIGSGGNCVIIDHGNGLSTCYMHLSAFACKVGDEVKGGQTIALSGSTGVSTGPHLHFAVRVNGEYVDPAPYLGLN